MRLLVPVLFAGFAVAAVVLVVTALRGDGLPGWFVVLWLAALGWNAYWWLFRIPQEVRVGGSTLAWSAPLRRGEVPLDDVVRLRPSRTGRQFAVVELRGRRPLVVPIRYGFAGFRNALAAGAPQAEVDEA
jgi:hypothetical protein